MIYNGQNQCTCLSLSRDPLCVFHGDVDKVFSHIERARIVSFIRASREDRAVVQVFDVLAKQIEEGQHWK